MSETSMIYPEDPFLPLKNEETLPKGTTKEDRAKRKRANSANKIFHQAEQFRIYAEIRQRELEIEKLKFHEILLRIEKKKKQNAKRSFIWELEKYYQMVFVSELQKIYEEIIAQGDHPNLSWTVFAENLLVEEPCFKNETPTTEKWHKLHQQSVVFRKQIDKVRDDFISEYGEMKYQTFEKYQEMEKREKAKLTYVALMSNSEDAAVAEIMFDEMTQAQQNDFADMLFEVDSEESLSIQPMYSVDFEVPTDESEPTTFHLRVSSRSHDTKHVPKPVPKATLQRKPVQKTTMKKPTAKWEATLDEFLSQQNAMGSIVQLIPPNRWQGFKERVRAFRHEVREEEMKKKAPKEKDSKNFEKIEPKTNSTREFMFRDEELPEDVVWNLLYERSKSCVQMISISDLNLSDETSFPEMKDYSHIKPHALPPKSRILDGVYLM